MSELKLSAEVRAEFGKGASRRLRQAGRIPAVIYGHGSDPVHVSLPGHETSLALRVANAVMTIAVPGQKDVLTLAKAVQRHPFKPIIEHVDLIIVKKGEKVVVEVALVVLGDDKDDRVVLVDQQTVSLEVEATAIPESIEVNVSGLEIGSQIFPADLDLPEGAAYVGDPEEMILSVNAPKAVSTATEEEEAEGGADEESTED